MEEQYLTVAEVADLLRVSRWSVGRYIDAQELTAIKADGKNGAVRVPVSSLRDYIDRHTVTAEESND